MKRLECLIIRNKSLLALALVIPLLAVLALGTPVQAAPLITLTPTSGAIGTRATINGENFDSYKGDEISIFFNGTEIPGSPLTVPETGTFIIDFYIPDDTDAGRYWVTVTSDVGATTLLARSFFIVEEAATKLDVADGPVGTEVNISGTGFYAGRTVTLYYYNIIGEKLGTQVASAVGEFTYRFTVPNSIAGTHKIKATNAEGDSVESEFEVIPSIYLNLTSAGPGELLTIRGTGFGYRGEVDIYFGTLPAANAKTDEYGNFEVEFNIPEVRPNPYDVKAIDEYGNTDKVKFTTTAGARLDQTSGAVGSKITVHGSGFLPGETATVDYDNLRVATVTTDNNGAFTTPFDIPISGAGDHVITVSDGKTTKQFAFNVEADAPPVPSLLLPANSSEARAETYLDWQDVTDPSSPVSYNLQVGSDQNFSSLVLEKQGLTESEYTLTEGEQLAAVESYAPYYWRIKAVDAAKNASEWSSPWSFYVSAPAPPTLMLPVSGSKAEKPLFINWQSVTSLSPPVTYHLQIASDLNFTSIVLEKQSLTDTEYILTEEEELPDVKPEAPYYWRVKAIDSANNASDWSTPWSFYTGSSFTMPGWAIYTLISIVVIIVGFLAFRLGKRTAFNPPE